jgi:hypothetical protein
MSRLKTRENALFVEIDAPILTELYAPSSDLPQPLSSVFANVCMFARPEWAHKSLLYLVEGQNTAIKRCWLVNATPQRLLVQGQLVSNRYH